MSLQRVAGKDVDSLGVSFVSLPPGTPIINRVVPGSWAEVQKLRVDDKLVCLNGRRVAEMARHEFCKCVQERPLTLDVFRPANMCSDEAVQNVESVIGQDINDASVEQTIPDARLSLCPSNLEELHPGSTSLVIGAAQKVDGINGNLANSVRFHLTVGHVVESLGVAFLALPPGKVVIDHIVPGSWAESQKLQAGDELVCMNGSEVAVMSRGEFLERMRERPLSLDLSRLASECAKLMAAAEPAGCASIVSSTKMVCLSVASDDDEKQSCPTETPEDVDSHEMSLGAEDSSETLSVGDASAGSSAGGANGVAEACAASEGASPTDELSQCQSECASECMWERHESISSGEQITVNLSPVPCALDFDELSSVLQKFRSRRAVPDQ